jgi:hypothetical protein
MISFILQDVYRSIRFDRTWNQSINQSINPFQESINQSIPIQSSTINQHGVFSESSMNTRGFFAQQALSWHVVQFEPDAIGIFEQHRVIARRPTALLGAVDDATPKGRQQFGGEKVVQLFDLLGLASAKAKMVQPAAALPEGRQAIFSSGTRDTQCRATADIVQTVVAGQARVLGVIFVEDASETHKAA